VEMASVAASRVKGKTGASTETANPVKARRITWHTQKDKYAQRHTTGMTEHTAM
jgi:hypothetical protein